MRRLLRLLEGAYGKRPWRRWGNGVDVLVDTILSQNTNAANSTAAYRRLRRELRTWESVADAPVERVEKAIRVAGLSRTKAPRIQGILREIRRDRGRITLEFLGRMGAVEALEYLLGFDGIGPKTAHCVLLFAFGMGVFPVDTHILRIAVRLGLVAAKTSAEEAHGILAGAIAPGDRYGMHILLIEHGRRRCGARKAECEGCALAEVCPACGGKTS